MGYIVISLRNWTSKVGSVGQPVGRLETRPRVVLEDNLVVLFAMSDQCDLRTHVGWVDAEKDNRKVIIMIETTRHVYKL